MMQGIPGFIFQVLESVLESSCFTAAIRFHHMMGYQNAAQYSVPARWESLNLFHFLAARRSYSTCLRLLKASIQQSSTIASATVRAKDDAEHAAHSFQRELELDAATMFTASARDSDSASTRLSLGRKQTWCEGKLRRGHYIRGLVVRHGNISRA